MTAPLIELCAVRQVHGDFTAPDRLTLSLPDTAAKLAIAGECVSAEVPVVQDLGPDRRAACHLHPAAASLPPMALPPMARRPRVAP